MTEAPRGAEAKARSRAETRTPRRSAERRAPFAKGCSTRKGADNLRRSALRPLALPG
jgi:hypothetical protein